MDKTYICKICGKQFKNGQAFGGHVVVHSEQWISSMNKVAKKKVLQRNIIVKSCEKCGTKFEVERIVSKNGIENISNKEKRFCSRICANGHKVSEETKKKISNGSMGNTSWNKGFNKGLGFNKGSRISCISCGKEIIKNISQMCFICYKKSGLHSLKMKGKTGGLRHGGGHGKNGWYKGYWCDSSWELAFVIYNLENNISFIRNKEGFEYTFEGKTYKYYPDFILEDGSYVEIKGYKTNQVQAKIDQFKYKLQILEKKDMQAYINYVKEKYGENYIKLYE